MLVLFDFHDRGYKVDLITGIDNIENLSDAIFCAEKPDETGEIMCSLFMVRYVDTNFNKTATIQLRTLRHVKNNIKLFNIFSICRERLTRQKKFLSKFIMYTNLNVNSGSFKLSDINVINRDADRIKTRNSAQSGENTENRNIESVQFMLDVPQTAYIFKNLLSHSKLLEIAKKIERSLVNRNAETHLRFLA